MRRLGIPETRENYLDCCYDDGNRPEEWGAEHEMQLPEHLQDPSLGRKK